MGRSFHLGLAQPFGVALAIAFALGLLPGLLCRLFALLTLLLQKFLRLAAGISQDLIGLHFGKTDDAVGVGFFLAFLRGQLPGRLRGIFLRRRRRGFYDDIVHIFEHILIHSGLEETFENVRQ